MCMQVPTEWCSGAWWQFRIDGNAGMPLVAADTQLMIDCSIASARQSLIVCPTVCTSSTSSSNSRHTPLNHPPVATAGLCDELPPCLNDRVLSFEGTSLIDTVGNADKKMGGYCGVVPPICMPDRGCK